MNEAAPAAEKPIFEKPKAGLNKTLTGWVLAFLVPCAIMLLPETATLTHELKVFLAITITAIVFFIFEQVNITVIGMMLPMAYVLILKSPAEAAFKPWSMSIVWMLVGSFLLANIMERVGLLRRIAYKCILVTGASYKGIIWGIALAGVVLFLLMPNDNAAVPIAALAYGICLSLHLRQGAEAGGIMLAAALAAMLPGCFLFNTGVFMQFSLGESVTGPLSMNWFEWLYINFPNALYYTLLFFVILKMFGKNATLNGKEYFQREYAAMGKLSINEKKVLVVIAILMAFIFTNSLHKIDVLWGFAIIPFFLYLPVLKVADNEDIKKINWGMIVFGAGCLAIGSVAGIMGFGDLISKAIVPIIDGKSHIFVLFLIYVGYFVLNFIMTPMAIMVTFTLPLAQVGIDIGLNPTAIYILMGNASDQILLPYEVVLWLVFFSFGMISMRNFIKFMAVKTVLNAAFMFLVLIPWWQISGFLTLK